jgi:hypothetical protein
MAYSKAAFPIILALLVLLDLAATSIPWAISPPDPDLRVAFTGTLAAAARALTQAEVP